jgi:hypothetical protein
MTPITTSRARPVTLAPAVSARAFGAIGLSPAAQAQADTTPPQVVFFGAESTPFQSVTNSTTWSVTVEFSEPVNGVDAGDFTLTYTGSTIARIRSVTVNPASPVRRCLRASVTA